MLHKEIIKQRRKWKKDAHPTNERKYNTLYQQRRRSNPDDIMCLSRPRSDIDPQTPAKSRNCSQCRQPFLPRTNTLFRCDACKSLAHSDFETYTIKY